MSKKEALEVRDLAKRCLNSIEQLEARLGITLMGMDLEDYLDQIADGDSAGVVEALKEANQ